MQSLDSSRSRSARASRSRRILNALTIAAFGALFLFFAPRAVHAIASPPPLAIGLTAAIHPTLQASLNAPALHASARDCDPDAARRSGPEFRRASRGDTSPLPDLWLDDRDDEDDDDLHRVVASLPVHVSPYHTLESRRSRGFEGVPVPNGKTPNQFVAESVRRM